MQRLLPLRRGNLLPILLPQSTVAPAIPRLRPRARHGCESPPFRRSSRCQAAVQTAARATKKGLVTRGGRIEGGRLSALRGHHPCGPLAVVLPLRRASSLSTGPPIPVRTPGERPRTHPRRRVVLAKVSPLRARVPTRTKGNRRRVRVRILSRIMPITPIDRGSANYCLPVR